MYVHVHTWIHRAAREGFLALLACVCVSVMVCRCIHICNAYMYSEGMLVPHFLVCRYVHIHICTYAHAYPWICRTSVHMHAHMQIDTIGTPHLAGVPMWCLSTYMYICTRISMNLQNLYTFAHTYSDIHPGDTSPRRCPNVVSIYILCTYAHAYPWLCSWARRFGCTRYTPDTHQIHTWCVPRSLSHLCARTHWPPSPQNTHHVGTPGVYLDFSLICVRAHADPSLPNPSIFLSLSRLIVPLFLSLSLSLSRSLTHCLSLSSSIVAVSKSLTQTQPNMVRGG